MWRHNLLLEQATVLPHYEPLPPPPALDYRVWLILIY